MTTSTTISLTPMYRLIKVLLIMACIAGYAYVSNMDYEDELLAQQAWDAYNQ